MPVLDPCHPRRRRSRQALTLALLALCATALWPATSHACKKRHQSPFELYDAASSVAWVKVTALPPPGAIKNRPGPGEVRLAVKQLLKAPGASPPASLTAQLGGTDCDVEFALDAEAVVLLGANGFPEGAYDGYLRHVDDWLPVLGAWAKAKDAAARVAVLVDAATATSAEVRREAVFFLLDEPALLAQLDLTQQKRLREQLAHPDNAPELALVLVRLRDPAATRALPRWHKLARAMVRLRGYEAEADPAKLAQAISSARQPAQRWAAFERCERARGAKLWRFSRYIEDLDRRSAAELAASCRDGTPIAR